MCGSWVSFWRKRVAGNVWPQDLPNKSMIASGAMATLCAMLYLMFSPFSSQADSADACNYGLWQPAFNCSVSCGEGVQEIRRVPEKAGDKDCPILKSSMACHAADCPKDCEGEWGTWSACQQDCTKTRRYRVVLDRKSGGKPCPERTGALKSATCTDGKCSVDCKVGQWTSGECTRPCGGGQQRHTRPVLTQPQGRGEPCPLLERWDSCNTHDCNYPRILAKLRDTLRNVTKGKPVMDIVTSEAEGFKSLAKVSHDLAQPQAKEWSKFVEEVRDLAREYHRGKKMLYQALAKLLALSKQAPEELEALVLQLHSGSFAHAKRRFLGGSQPSP